MRYGRLKRLYKAITNDEVFNECTKWEYSAKLQMNLLGLNPETIIQPVLDVGCGNKGNLVKRLRSLGIEAYGMDMLPPAGGDFIEGEWLEFDFGAYRWGTVLSHMAFSNHFAHHSMRVTGSFQAYRATYERILCSITTGGSFIYAPGLPSFESMIPKDDFGVSITRIACIGCDTDRFHAVKVTKLD